MQPDAAPRRRGRRTAFGPAVLAQLMLVLAAGAIAFAPAEHGPMLLVPLGPIAAPLDADALGIGAARAGPGPLPGSFYAVGERWPLVGAALRHGFLPINGRPRLCAPAQKGAQ